MKLLLLIKRDSVKVISLKSRTKDINERVILTHLESWVKWLSTGFDSPHQWELAKSDLTQIGSVKPKLWIIWTKCWKKRRRRRRRTWICRCRPSRATRSAGKNASWTKIHLQIETSLKCLICVYRIYLKNFKLDSSWGFGRSVVWTRKFKALQTMQRLFHKKS